MLSRKRVVNRRKSNKASLFGIGDNRILPTKLISLYVPLPFLEGSCFVLYFMPYATVS
jgi:hypothetical protein